MFFVKHVPPRRVNPRRKSSTHLSALPTGGTADPTTHPVHLHFGYELTGLTLPGSSTGPRKKHRMS